MKTFFCPPSFQSDKETLVPPSQSNKETWPYSDPYLAFDGKSRKKSPSQWSLKDHPCDLCGATFTQSHSLKSIECIVVDEILREL